MNPFPPFVLILLISSLVTIASSTQIIFTSSGIGDLNQFYGSSVNPCNISIQGTTLTFNPYFNTTLQMAARKTTIGGKTAISASNQYFYYPVSNELVMYDSYNTQFTCNLVGGTGSTSQWLCDESLFRFTTVNQYPTKVTVSFATPLDSSYYCSCANPCMCEQITQESTDTLTFFNPSSFISWMDRSYKPVKGHLVDCDFWAFEMTDNSLFWTSSDDAVCQCSITSATPISCGEQFIYNCCSNNYFKVQRCY